MNYTYEPQPSYNRAIDSAKSTHELLDALSGFKLLAIDALEAIQSPAFVWREFKDGLDKERKKQFAGIAWQEKYAHILMPDVMFDVYIVAQKYAVPFGLAYIRCREEGLIVEKDGVARLARKLNSTET